MTVMAIKKPLVLAVEVLSPSTRRKDLVLQRSQYQDVGVAPSWVLDPDEPSIVRYDLPDGGYAGTGRAVGSDRVSAPRPFPLTIMPSALVRR